MIGRELVLECLCDEVLTILCDLSGRDLVALPVCHKIGVLRRENLERTVSMDSNDLENVGTEAQGVFFLLLKLVELQQGRAFVA